MADSDKKASSPSPAKNHIPAANNGDQEGEAEDKEAENKSRETQQKLEDDVDEMQKPPKKRRSLILHELKLRRENGHHPGSGGGPSDVNNNGLVREKMVQATTSSSALHVGQAIKRGNGGSVVVAGQGVLAGRIGGGHQSGGVSENVGSSHRWGDRDMAAGLVRSVDQARHQRNGSAPPKVAVRGGQESNSKNVAGKQLQGGGGASGSVSLPPPRREVQGQDSRPRLKDVAGKQGGGSGGASGSVSLVHARRRPRVTLERERVVLKYNPRHLNDLALKRSE